MARSFNGLKEWVGGIFSNINVGGIIRGITGKGPEEILLFIADHLRVMLRWISTNIAPVTSRIHEILKKIQSVFEWVHGLFQRFWNWIQQAMPGAAKETKRLEIDKAISKQNAADKTKSLSYSRTSGVYTVRDMTVSSGSYHTLTENDYGKEKYKSLTKKSAEYQALPGFAEGIAQAVAKGISGIGTTIADAIVGAIGDLFPDFSGLTTSLENLVKPLTDFTTWMTEHTNPAGVAAGKASEDKLTAAGVKSIVGGYYEWIEPSAHPGEDAEAAANKALGNTYAVGATFKTGGRFRGRVHDTEEITPQAITKRGPGPIAKAVDLLNNVTSGKRGMSSANDVSGVEVHVHMPTQDFSGMKISSDVDFERLLRDANKKAVADAVYELKKLIGQRRT